jgi:hypothetical protein
MIIENKKGIQFDITSEEWNTSIVAKGNEHKYRVVEDDSPVEVKQLRLIKETKKKKP